MQGARRIGLLGTGTMGLPMGEHLIKAGFPLTVYNRTQSKAFPLRDKGANLVDEAGQVLGEADVTLSMLFDYKSIQETVLPHVSLLKGKQFVQMGTIAPKENIDLQHAIEEAGGQYIEAPVLGTRSVAQAGKLQVLVGSTKEQYDSLTDVFKSFGAPLHVGTVSAASTMKLILNQFVVGQTALLANSLAMIKRCEHLGLKEESFFPVLAQSALYCKYFDIKRPAMSKRDFSDISFDIEGATKDAELIAAEAGNLGVDTTILDAIKEVYQRAATDFPGNDFGVVYNVINPQEKEKEK